MTRSLRSVALAIALIACCAPARAQDSEVELSVSGQYRARAFSLRNGSLARLLDPATIAALQQSGRDKVDERQNFFDSRLRLKLTAARGSELALRMQFEIGDLTFGGTGAQLGTDGVNIETKWLHLEWTPAALPLSLKVGLFSEVTPKSLILSNDVAGIRAEYKPFKGKVSVTAELLKAIDNSRADLDNDGLRDNDFNDRDISMLRLDVNAFKPWSFGVYGMSDIDNSADSPVAANVERDIYWLGGFVKGQVGQLGLSVDGIYAFGDLRNAQNPGSIRIEAFAVDARVSFSLPFVGVELIAGWGSGDDPDTRQSEAFPTITTFYAHSNIIFDDYGGFNVTGSSLSGVAHLSALLRASPLPGLELKLIAIWATYTADPRRATNVNRVNLTGRELGFELGLNGSYAVSEGFKLVTRNGIFFPGTGYETTFDTPDDDPLLEFIVGMEFRF